MMNISQNIIAGVFFVFWIAFWGLIIYAALTFLQRLSEISRSLQSIDAKLSPPPRRDAGDPEER